MNCQKYQEQKFKIITDFMEIRTRENEPVFCVHIDSNPLNICLSVSQLRGNKQKFPNRILGSFEFVEEVFEKAKAEHEKVLRTDEITAAFQKYKEEIMTAIKIVEEDLKEFVEKNPVTLINDEFIKKAVEGEVTTELIENLVSEWASIQASPCPSRELALMGKIEGSFVVLNDAINEQGDKLKQALRKKPNNFYKENQERNKQPKREREEHEREPMRIENDFTLHHPRRASRETFERNNEGSRNRPKFNTQRPKENNEKEWNPLPARESKGSWNSDHSWMPSFPGKERKVSRDVESWEDSPSTMSTFANNSESDWPKATSNLEKRSRVPNDSEFFEDANDRSFEKKDFRRPFAPPRKLNLVKKVNTSNNGQHQQERERQMHQGQRNDHEKSSNSPWKRGSAWQKNNEKDSDAPGRSSWQPLKMRFQPKAALPPANSSWAGALSAQKPEITINTKTVLIPRFKKFLCLGKRGIARISSSDRFVILSDDGQASICSTSPNFAEHSSCSLPFELSSFHSSLAVSNSGSSFLILDHFGKKSHLVSLSSCRLQRTFSLPFQPWRALWKSSKEFVIAFDKGLIQFFSSNKLVQSIQPFPNECVADMAFCEDDLICCTRDGQVFRLSFKAKKALWSSSFNIYYWVEMIAMTPCKKFLLVAGSSNNRRINMVDVSSGKKVKSFNDFGGSIRTLSISKNGEFVCLVQEKEIRLFAFSIQKRTLNQISAIDTSSFLCKKQAFFQGMEVFWAEKYILAATTDGKLFRILFE